MEMNKPKKNNDFENINEFEKTYIVCWVCGTLQLILVFWLGLPLPDKIFVTYGILSILVLSKMVLLTLELIRDERKKENKKE